MNGAQIPAAMFHLENIHGPVLLLAAGDDQIWNSVAQSKMALSYLHAHHHPYDDQLLQYPGAGHVFLFSAPGRPMTDLPMGPFTLLLGGTPKSNLAAQQQAWPKIMAFLQNAWKAEASASGK